MKKIKIIIIFISLIFISGLCLYIYKWEYRKREFEINFFSLNKGRAVFMRSSNNKTILVGGGQNSDTIRELTKVMPFYIKKIDYIFLPSATPAQIGGLIEIVDRYDIGEVVMPKYISTSTVLTILMKNIRKKKIHVKEVEKGDEFNIGELKVDILFPNEDFKYNKSSLPELGLSISYTDTAVYLIGNLSKTIQKNIAKDLEINTKENLIEFYNSASESKVSADLIEKIRPKFIFSTKEKSIRWVSNGFFWSRP